MARTARTLRQLEQRVQTLRPLGRARGLGGDACTFCAGGRYGKRDARRHCDPRPHVCGGRVKKNGPQDEQALGRSRGGFSTKIHAVVDALGNPLRFLLTAGQRHEITQAEPLLDDLDFEQVIADMAYDSNDFLDFIAAQGALAVIPSRANRTEPHEYDEHLYKERHLVECFFNKIKWFRRIFTRFDKLARRYLAFLHFAAALIWLK